MGASFAWYAWKSSEVNVNVNFADLDPYIKKIVFSGTFIKIFYIII